MPALTHQNDMKIWKLDDRFIASWPIVAFVAALSTYAFVCMIGLVVGMTAAHGL